MPMPYAISVKIIEEAIATSNPMFFLNIIGKVINNTNDGKTSHRIPSANSATFSTSDVSL